MSKHHKVCYDGRMVEAYKFCEDFQHVYKIKYNGEVLYNVLLEEHSTIRVNNMVCETLHPKNIVAKLYNNNSDQDSKNKIIVLMNDCIKKNDYSEYKKVASRL